MKKSLLELNMRAILRDAGFPPWVEEYRFYKNRKWRFDFAWPKKKIAVEVEGGTFSGGRHTRGDGFAKDCEKYNRAALLGWKVLRYTAGSLNDVVEDLKKLL